MPNLISTIFQQEGGVKGFAIKQLYCPICHDELFGEYSKQSLEYPYASSYWEYECFTCGRKIFGDEAKRLYFQFIEDLI
jgi:hypothetical protein